MVHGVLLVGQLPFQHCGSTLAYKWIQVCSHELSLHSETCVCFTLWNKTWKDNYYVVCAGKKQKKTYHVNIFSFNQGITIHSHFIGQTWSHCHIQSPQFGEVSEILWLKFSIARARENKQSTNNKHCCSRASRVHSGK